MKLVGVLLLFFVGKSGCWVTHELLRPGFWKAKIGAPEEFVPKVDILVCNVFPVRDLIPPGVSSDTVYVTSFSSYVEDNVVHHELLKFCLGLRYEVPGEPGKYTESPNYTGQCPICARRSVILGIESLQKGFTYPKGVSYAIHPGLENLYVHLHYKKESPSGKDNSYLILICLYLQTDPTPKNAHMIQLRTRRKLIPPGRPSFFVFTNYQIKDGESEMYIHYAHTHPMGKEMRGFKVEKNSLKVKEVFRNNQPTVEQFHLFDPKLKDDLKLSAGDYLACSCEYSSINKTRAVATGNLRSEEMCDMYILVLSKSSIKMEGIEYHGEENPSISHLIESEIKKNVV